MTPSPLGMRATGKKPSAYIVEVRTVLVFIVSWWHCLREVLQVYPVLHSDDVAGSLRVRPQTFFVSSIVLSFMTTYCMHPPHFDMCGHSHTRHPHKFVDEVIIPNGMVQLDWQHAGLSLRLEVVLAPERTPLFLGKRQRARPSTESNHTVLFLSQSWSFF